MNSFKRELNQLLNVTKVEQGRFAEEENITLEKDGKRVLFIKAFYGRKPYWKEWVELFHISPDFFGSELEDKLYEILSKHFRRVFVEYYEDAQTLMELKAGKPPEETRLGSKLKALGYRFFRDWYYPEGWMEGGYKIQAER
ncbi:MAG: DUF1122 family protein [Aquificaceae bacterium]|nr:DUF1122 family protein [Aquificaceae bacterium]MDW8422806.1 DUF1122 family protein [Aquificaceae bacterium]